MDREIKKVNDILVNLFNTVLRLEEEAVHNSSHNDISITEVHTLAAIGTGRPRTMTHVANILGISVSTLTTAINRLVKKGYVDRLRDERDRRIVKIHLTEKGVSAVRDHDEFHESMIREGMTQVPEEDFSQFISSLDNISHFVMMRSSTTYRKEGSFEMKPLQLGANILPVPLIQAGMGIGVAGRRLAAAVAMQGGLGLIGTAEIGSRAEDYGEDSLKANLRAVENEVAAARKLVNDAGGKGLIGASIMWNDPNAGQYVKAAVRGGAQVIVTSAGVPKELPRYCDDRKVALVPTISSQRAAAAITKAWTQKYNRTPDGFIFQGPLAAGLLGFKEAEMEMAYKNRYKIVAEIKAGLSKMENCPLIAGGGIFDKADAEKVYMYGADGFLLGTRFVTTEECDASDEYKKLYLNCTENDVTIIRSPMKTSVRVMKNRFADSLAESGSMDYDIIEAVKRGVDGDFDGGLIFCSVNADKITKIDTVEDVFREFTT